MGVLDLIKTVSGKGKGAGNAPLIDLKAGYRTDEQEKAVFYFSDENKQGCLKGCFPEKKKVVKPGCFPKNTKGCFPKKKFKFVSDAEYDALVQSIIQRLDPKNKGLSKLNLDESQIEKTISFQNYKYRSIFDSDYFKDGAYFWKIGEDGRFRSSVFEVTYLFFTQNQILSYQLTLSSDWEKHDEQTYEYHYKDITACSTETRQEDVIEDEKKVFQTVMNEFQITVPNASFSVALGNKPTKEEEDAIQAMKALLREKKA